MPCSKLTPADLKRHESVRSVLKVVKNQDVCIYRNGFLKALASGKISVISSPNLVSQAEVACGEGFYAVHQYAIAETASVVYAIPSGTKYGGVQEALGSSDLLVFRVL